MKKTSLFIITLLAACTLSAQNINGIWRGTLTQGTGGCFKEYNIELQITLKGTIISGASYHYSDMTNYVKEEFSGTFTSANKTLIISEEKVLTFRVPSDCIPCIKKYTLAYKRTNSTEELTGEWGGVTMNNFTACPPGKITLSRVAESDFSHIKEIKVDTGIIHLDFYDNAQIDGDIISVLLNNQPLISNQLLSAKPVRVEIKVDLDHTEQEITMVAVNQGEIPPNTALLIVTAGKKRYQLYLSSTDRKNAIVRFIYEDPTTSVPSKAF